MVVTRYKPRTKEDTIKFLEAEHCKLMRKVRMIEDAVFHLKKELKEESK